MSDERLLREMVAEIEKLKAEVKRLSAQNRLYEIINYVVPPILTADQNNYDIGNYAWVILQSNASRTITGFTGGVNGRVLRLFNIGGNNIVLANQNAGSIGVNQIVVPGLANLTMAPYGGTGLYSAVELVWGGTWLVHSRFAP